MARLIRMDQTGHTTLAEWTGEDGAEAAATRQKLVANSWVLAATAAAGETLALARALDVAPDDFFGLIADGPLDMGYLHAKAQLILEEAELKRFPRARDLVILTIVAVVENFGYRQINNFWRVKGYWQYLKRDNSWGEMTRTGFSSKAD